MRVTKVWSHHRMQKESSWMELEQLIIEVAFSSIRKKQTRGLLVQNKDFVRSSPEPSFLDLSDLVNAEDFVLNSEYLQTLMVVVPKILVDGFPLWTIYVSLLTAACFSLCFICNGYFLLSTFTL
ncbi:hypothetical protein L596_005919 [Steinernema carpocapsae]|uniref:V-type proton ATPase subunit C n=1 Tax=Steinernema carpocapsae TaxID=34508 RepID=A0A4U8V1T9_STECR|nr:hypothetical protein L596_005919 [Steinernema carpocapsae]